MPDVSSSDDSCHLADDAGRLQPQRLCRILGIAPFVVEQEGHIVAYADVQSNGCIDHFFDGAAYREGVMPP